MKKFVIVLMIALIILPLMGCNIVMKAFSKKEDNLSTKQIKSEDGSVLLTVPDNWKAENGVNEYASLVVCNPSKTQYVMIIKDSKIDFNDDFNLNSYLEAVKQIIDIEDPKWIEESSEFHGKYQAIYTEVNGSVDGIKIQYYVKLIDCDDYFYRLFGWTSLSKADENRGSINKIIDTFAEAA